MEHPKVKDKRGSRIIFLSHCILNQNAKVRGIAEYPGAIVPLVELLLEQDIGMYQMPCPEMVCLALPRTREPAVSIRDVLDTPEGRSRCEELSVSVVDTIDEYRRNSYTVVAVLGGDVGSPGCAVPPPSAEAGGNTTSTGFGVFTKALLDELRRRDIQIPISIHITPGNAICYVLLGRIPAGSVIQMAISI